MRIVGGSFGVKGSAFISGNALMVEGSSKGQYQPAEVRSVSARVDAEKKFGFIGATIGALLLGGLGMVFLGLFGAIVGVLIAVAGSFYSSKKNLADVSFADGKTLSLECTDRAIGKLVRFADL